MGLNFSCLVCSKIRKMQRPKYLSLIKTLMFNIMLVAYDLKKTIFLSREIIVSVKMLCAGGKILKTS
jgi:hypothetical protein